MVLVDNFPSYAVSAVGPRSQVQFFVACLALPYKSRWPWSSVYDPVLQGSGLYAERGPQSLLGLSSC